MHNLKTVKSHTVKAHLDRLQDTAENLAAWASGEMLAGRRPQAMELAVLVDALLGVKANMSRVYEVTRGPELSEN